MCKERRRNVRESDSRNIIFYFDSSAVVLRKELDVTYLEALVETGDNLFEGAILQEELSESAIERLNREYSTFNEETYKGEEIRKAFQLAILKGMKEGVQANHEMTPDAVGMFMSYLFHKFMQGQNEITVLDPAIGTGNLMTTVFNSAKEGLTMSGFGVEVDEVLICFSKCKFTKACNRILPSRWTSTTLYRSS